MNASRRKNIQALIERLIVTENAITELIKGKLTEYKDQLDDIKNELEELKYEEQEYMDNMPESLHSSDKYDIAQSSVQEMETLLSSLDEMIENITTVIDFDLSNPDSVLEVI